MQTFLRKTGEAIRIGDEILVEVIEADDGKVRLGVVAPRDIGVVEVNADARATSLAERDVAVSQASGNDDAAALKGE